MIVHKIWTTSKGGNFPFGGISYNTKESSWEGYFLLGIIPLYIKNVKAYYLNKYR